jgi:hypothetical protein
MVNLTAGTSDRCHTIPVAGQMGSPFPVFTVEFCLVSLGDQAYLCSPATLNETSCTCQTCGCEYSGTDNDAIFAMPCTTYYEYTDPTVTVGTQTFLTETTTGNRRCVSVRGLFVCDCGVRANA